MVQHFVIYETRCQREADRQSRAQREVVQRLKTDLDKLKEVRPNGEAEQLMRNLILYLTELQTNLNELKNVLISQESSDNAARDLVRILRSMLSRGVLEM
jgi:hypothetical protein